MKRSVSLNSSRYGIHSPKVVLQRKEKDPRPMCFGRRGPPPPPHNPPGGT